MNTEIKYSNILHAKSKTKHIAWKTLRNNIFVYENIIMQIHYFEKIKL